MISKSETAAVSEVNSDNLRESFPRLYRKDGMFWGFECDDGRHRIIYDLSVAVDASARQLQILLGRLPTKVAQDDTRWITTADSWEENALPLRLQVFLLHPVPIERMSSERTRNAARLR
jgi:hypothetical protein